MNVDLAQFSDPRSPWWWWWRQRRGWDPVRLIYLPPKGNPDELGAYRFELMRRFDRTRPGQPYPVADSFTRDLLAPSDLGHPPIAVGPKQNWGPIMVALPEIGYNPAAHRGQIQKALMQLIDQDCKRRGVKLARGLQGRRNKPVSWVALELLDRKQVAGETKFSDAERARQSQTERDAKHWQQVWRKKLRSVYPVQ
jgi:hypothetical protein